MRLIQNRATAEFLISFNIKAIFWAGQMWSNAFNDKSAAQKDQPQPDRAVGRAPAVLVVHRNADRNQKTSNKRNLDNCKHKIATHTHIYIYIYIYAGKPVDFSEQLDCEMMWNAAKQHKLKHSEPLVSTDGAAVVFEVSGSFSWSSASRETIWFLAMHCYKEVRHVGSRNMSQHSLAHSRSLGISWYCEIRLLGVAFWQSLWHCQATSPVKSCSCCRLFSSNPPPKINSFSIVRLLFNTPQSQIILNLQRP